MTRHADQFPKDLNLGQLQRVKLAKAIMHEPELIICDEPVLNDDPRSTLITFDALKKYAADTQAMVIVASSQPEDCRYYADHLIILKQGRITYDGEPLMEIKTPKMAAVNPSKHSPLISA